MYWPESSDSLKVLFHQSWLFLFKVTSAKKSLSSSSNIMPNMSIWQLLTRLMAQSIGHHWVNIQSRKSIRCLMIGSCSFAFSSWHGEMLHMKKNYEWQNRVFWQIKHRIKIKLKKYNAHTNFISNNYSKVNFANSRKQEWVIKIRIADTLQEIVPISLY